MRPLLAVLLLAGCAGPYHPQERLHTTEPLYRDVINMPVELAAACVKDVREVPPDPGDWSFGVFSVSAGGASFRLYPAGDRTIMAAYKAGRWARSEDPSAPWRWRQAVLGCVG